MDRNLESAFRRTRYRVITPAGDLLLRVDQAEPALADLLRSHDAPCAALLTAFNPGGRRHPPFRNRRWQARLWRELQALGYAVLPARNEDPRHLWPVEDSVLAVGLTLASARQLAACHGQVALLWIQADGTPRLIETAEATRGFRRCGPRPTPRRCCPTRPAA